MKKLLFGLVCLGALYTMVFGEDYSIKTNDLKSFYNVKEKKCNAMPFNMKTNIINDLRNGTIIVDSKYTNDAGTTYIVVGEWANGQEYEMILTSNWNQCRFYEDLVIKKMDVYAKDYMNHSIKK